MPAPLGIDADAIAQLVRRRTLVSNAILERKGARTALLATPAFCDILVLAIERRYDFYDFELELTSPLVSRWLCLTSPSGCMPTAPSPRPSTPGTSNGSRARSHATG